MVQSKLMEDEEDPLDFQFDNISEKKKSNNFGFKRYCENISKFVDAPFVKYLYHLVRHIQLRFELFILYFSMHM